jgi:hypothetical protein
MLRPDWSSCLWPLVAEVSKCQCMVLDIRGHSVSMVLCWIRVSGGGARRGPEMKGFDWCGCDGPVWALKVV